MSLLCLWHAIHQLGRQVIYTIVRIITPEDLEWYLEDCLSLKQKYPDVLAGSYKLRRQRMKAKSLTAFDIVGPEEVAYPLIHYINPLLAFREKCNSIGVDLPFLFHAGETLGDGGFVSFCFLQSLYYDQETASIRIYMTPFFSEQSALATRSHWSNIPLSCGCVGNDRSAVKFVRLGELH